MTAIPMPVIVKSGAHVVGDFKAEIASGTIIVPEVEVSSGIGVQIQSGIFVVIESGIGVITVANVSGQSVTISGNYVYVESGVHVVGDFSTTVDSGLHVVVGSGLGVVGDFTAEVASGLYVVQSKTVQLQNYFISDIDESDADIKFYGYKDVNNNWYIMQETSGTTYRYASSGIYASNWIDRSGIGYQMFDQEF